MRIDSSQKKRSPCDKFMQIMKNILKLLSPPFLTTDVRSSSSHSPPHKHDTVVKQHNNKTQKGQNSHHLVGLDGEGSSSFIKIQGTDHHDIGRTNDVNWFNDMQTSELNASVTNLKVSDYIRRFHERIEQT